MQDKIVSRGLAKIDRIPPGQKPVDKWPVLHYNSIPYLQGNDWSLEIKGLVNRPMHISFNEFETLPQVTLIADAHCVEGWSLLNNEWRGVPTTVIQDIAHVLPEAKFVIVSSGDGYTTNVDLNDFFAFDSILATHHNNMLLSAEHGYPVRLVISSLYFWKSAKWVTTLDFTSQDNPGFWESRGYHNHGDPWLQERSA